MDGKDCKMLVALDEEGNMTVAARKLFVSQPALTYRLRQLEERFEAPIFTREKSGLIATPQGELIIQYARDNLKYLTETVESIELMGRQIRGTIKLGVASTYGQYVLPDVISRFTSKYPEVDFEIITGLSSMIADMFTKGDVHIGIFRGEFPWEEQKVILASESICLTSKSPVLLHELPSMSRIEYQMDEYLKKIVNIWWRKNFNKESNVSMTVDSLETAKELVRTGLGFTVLPGICLTGENELHIQPLKDEQDKVIKRMTWAYCRNQTLQYASVHTFFQFLQVNSHGELPKLT